MNLDSKKTRGFAEILFPLIYRIGAKVWVIVCWLYTLYRGYIFEKDRSKILLDHSTPGQKNAAGELQALNLDFQSTNSRSVLVIIPYRDNSEMTVKCIESLSAQVLSNIRLEVALVDNQSVSSNTRAGIDSAIQSFGNKQTRFHLLSFDEPFNFSKINNFAVNQLSAGKPDYFMFLNNDVEMQERDSIQKLVSFSESNSNSGAVGCTLLFPDRITIQHLFAAPGVKIIAAHPLKGSHIDTSWEWFRAPQPVSAVTGALLLVKANDFYAVQGFDEKLPILGQDIDLCLRLQALGRVNWTVSQVVMVHHESITRPELLRNTAKFDRDEVAYFYTKHSSILRSNPMFSCEISTWSEFPLLTPVNLKYPVFKVI